MVINGSVDDYNMLHLETSTPNGDCMQNFTGFVINEFSSHGHNFCRQSYWYQKEWETTRQRGIGTLFENMNRSIGQARLLSKNLGLIVFIIDELF